LTITPTALTLSGVKHMSILPIDRFVRCAFYTPTGVEGVRVHRTEIVGDWKFKKDHYPDKSLTLAQRFANSTCDAKSVLRFTERWGPLSGNPYDGKDGFRFTVESWAGTQQALQQLWRVVQHNGAIPFQPAEPIVVEFAPKGTTLRCPDLYHFMCFELMSNSKRLRICKREDCGTPYFLAQHGKEQYCSPDCANWAQSVWKKRWHEEQRQRRIKTGENDGTQKTR
jgi:hypothetical protein